MKINNLELTNFRNHVKSFMAFDKINFFIGKNNSGKSSIKGALDLSLTGENEWFNGRNAKRLIKHGEKEASVEVEIEKLGLIKRSIAEKGGYVELNSGKIPDKEVQKEILEEFDVSYDALSCVVNSSKFLNMKPDDQKDFLFKLSKAVLTPQHIISFMDNPSQEAKDIVIKTLPNNVPIDVLDKTYDGFFAVRRESKRNYASLKTQVEAAGTLPNNSGVDILSVEAKLGELKLKKEGTIKKIAVVDEQIRQKNKLTSYLDRVNQRISDIKSKIDPKINLADAEETVFGFITEINDAVTGLDKQKTVYNVLEDQTKSLKNIVKKINTSVCPLSSKIICKTDKSFLITDLQKQVESNEEKISDAKNSINSLNQKIIDLNKKKQHLEDQIGLAGELEEQNAQKEQYSNDLKAIAVQDKTALENEEKKYEDEMNEQEKLKSTHNEWVRKNESLNKLEKEYQDALNKVTTYDYLVKEFSPKGVKARMLAKIIGPIEQYCNEKLSVLTNGKYKISFDFSNNFDIIVENTSGQVYVNDLSNSEKLRIGVIFQDAINNAVGTKILLVDDAEILDEENTQLFLALIDNIKDNYDSIFIIATNEDKSAAANLKKINGSKVFYVNNGNVAVA